MPYSKFVHQKLCHTLSTSSHQVSYLTPSCKTPLEQPASEEWVCDEASEWRCRNYISTSVSLSSTATAPFSTIRYALTDLALDFHQTMKGNSHNILTKDCL